MAEHNTETENAATVSGGRCRDCEHFSLPLPRLCPICMSAAIEEATVSGFGKVYSSTVVRSGPKDRELPYGLAHVDLDSGLRVLAVYDIDDSGLLLPDTDVIVAEVGRSEAGLPLVKVIQRGSVRTPEAVAAK